MHASLGWVPGHTCHLTARRFTSSHLCATWVADLGALASNCELTDLLATWVAATGREGGMPPDTSHCWAPSGHKTIQSQSMVRMSNVKLSIMQIGRQEKVLSVVMGTCNIDTSHSWLNLERHQGIGQSMVDDEDNDNGEARSKLKCCQLCKEVVQEKVLESLAVWWVISWSKKGLTVSWLMISIWHVHWETEQLVHYKKEWCNNAICKECTGKESDWGGN